MKRERLTMRPEKQVIGQEQRVPRNDMTGNARFKFGAVWHNDLQIIRHLDNASPKGASDMVFEHDNIAELGLTAQRHRANEHDLKMRVRSRIGKELFAAYGATVIVHR